MLSIKEYARSKNISYEAVRKQVKRYHKELEGHISVSNRTQYLDEEAIAFLDAKRESNPIVMYESSKDEEIQRLSNENKLLLMKVTELQDALLAEKDSVKLLQQEKISLLEDYRKERKEPQKVGKGFFSRFFKK